MSKPMLAIQKYSPKILHQYIESFNVYYFNKDVPIQLFPKGVFELVFQSNDHFQHNTSYSLGWEVRPANFIGGLHNKSYTVKPNGDKDYCIVAEFKPNTAKYFIPSKLNSFKNNVVDIFEIWGKPAVELSQKINQEQINSNRISIIENFLASKFITRKPSIIDNTIHIIASSKGFVEINKLARNVALSTAQFRKRFNEEIGISPSQYCKIVRINSALAILEKNSKNSLTELTYQLGYFDQSHFIKDFKAVVGYSPKILKKAI